MIKKITITLSIALSSPQALSNEIASQVFNITSSGSDAVSYLPFSLTTATTIDIANAGRSTDPYIYLFSGSGESTLETLIARDDDSCLVVDCGPAGSYTNSLINDLTLQPGSYTVAIANFPFSEEEARTGQKTNTLTGDILTIVGDSELIIPGTGTGWGTSRLAPFSSGSIGSGENPVRDLQLLQAAIKRSAVKRTFSSTSMASTSSSTKVNDTVYNSIINPSIQTRAQQKQQLDRPIQKLIVAVTDLRYERAEFTDTNNTGNIGGFAASGSYDINKNFTVGAVVPYDYLSFKTFDAHRTGIILYGKNTLKLPSHFELSSAINGNYMYTATQFKVLGDNRLSTYGGGFSTRMTFDNNSSFVPSAAFSYQYNEDNSNFQDNHQHLVKLGPSLGYRVLDNATIQVSGNWTKDITDYKQLQNGNDYYDVGIESGWVISDTWQLRGGYKKILGLANFESDSFYLGSSAKF